MVTAERTAMTVQLEEQEPRFQPPDLSPDWDREEGRAMDRGEEDMEEEDREEGGGVMDRGEVEVVKEEAVLDLDRVEDTAVSGFSFTFIHLSPLNINP